MEKEEKGEDSEPKEDLKIRERGGWGQSAGWSNLFLSSQTGKLMAGTKFSDYLGLKHYTKAKKLKHFIHLRSAQRPQSFNTYHTTDYGHPMKA